MNPTTYFIEKKQATKNQEKKTTSPNFEEKVAKYQSLIRKIEKRNINPDACGAYKKCFSFPKDGIVILKSKGFTTVKIEDGEEDLEFKGPDRTFFERKEKIDRLKALGISTPGLLYECDYLSYGYPSPYDDSTIKSAHNYTVMELAPGNQTELYRYEVAQEKFVRFYPSRKMALNAMTTTQKEFQQRFLEYSKKDMALRVLTQQHHLGKFIQDFERLNFCDAFRDSYGENVLYDPDLGFTFIDLSLSTAKNLNLSLDQVIERTSSENTNKAFFNGSLLELMWGYGANFKFEAHCPDVITSEDRLQSMILNGIANEQLLRAVATHLDEKNDFSPKFKNRVSDFIVGHSRNSFSFDDIQSIYDAVTSISPSKMHNLSGLLETKRLFYYSQAIKSYTHSYSTFLEAINLPIFLQAMKNMQTGADCTLDENGEPIIDEETIAQCKEIQQSFALYENTLDLIINGTPDEPTA